MKIERNVRLEKASAQIFFAIMIADRVVREATPADATVTSCGDGVHSRPDSKHYPDPKTGLVNAFDLRIKDFDGNLLDISGKDCQLAGDVCKLLRASLGPQYDVIVEANHIHVEFDPK